MSVSLSNRPKSTKETTAKAGSRTSSSDGGRETDLNNKEHILNSVINATETIKRFTTNLKKSNAGRINESFLDARQELIQSYWDGFRENFTQLEAIVTAEDKRTLLYFVNDEYSMVEEAYLDARTYIKQKQRELFPAEINDSLIETTRTVHGNAISISHPSRSKLIKLPPISIPKFDGDYMLWPSFYDMFTALVHNDQSIPAVQKLHYLKANLTGEPEKMIRNVQVTALNYAPAWQQLVNRYDNKRVLVNSRLKILFEQPKMHSDSPAGIKRLLDTTNEILNSLNNLGIDTSGWNYLIVFIVVQRLTNETHQLWEQSLNNTRELPNYVDLQEFLEARYRTLELLADTRSSGTNRSPKRQSFHTSTFVQKCALCQGAHSIRVCSDFKQKPTNLKFEVAKQKRLCINCLTAGHSIAKCPSKTRCFECHKKHHTLLHIVRESNKDLPSPVTETDVADQDKPSTSATAKLNTFHTSNMIANHVILATALVRITSDSGQELVVRALLDQASEASFISESIARRLQLKFDPAETKISGIGDGITTSTHHTKFVINAFFQNKLNLEVRAYILKSLTGTIPSNKLAVNSWPHTRELKLADPNFDTPGKIDLLLGVDVYNHILMADMRRGLIGSPIAQKTRLGWVLSGTAPTQSNEEPNSSITIISRVSLLSIDTQIRKFWEVEELPTESILTEEEQHCERHFSEHYKRSNNGRFIVKLPFKSEFGTKYVLGRSKSIAVSRLYQIENKFRKNEQLYLDYSKCLKEYLDLSHMEIMSSTENELLSYSEDHGFDIVDGCYIPHHAVIKDSSTTTKTRVVFDASRITHSGKSLNDCLLNGPTLQDSIMSILLRWRKHKVAITGDVEKMYRQIEVDETDSNYQRIVWRWRFDEPIREYRLKTLTFGTKPAAYLAIKCMQTLAEIEAKQLSRGAEAVANDFYVDDLLSGADTIVEAVTKRNEIIKVLNKGCFQLRKWASNEYETISDLPGELCETKSILKIEDDAIKALGIYWKPSTDTFKFKITLSPLTILSKRTILSDIAKLYDPNGWLAPVVIRAKILMQGLWMIGTNWDEQPPQNIADDWVDFRNGLWALEEISIPRWINTKVNCVTELHCFTDASIHAYAAVAYIRVTDIHGHVSSKLLTAKTKVAPIQQISLPRLELCAVNLGANLIKSIIDSMKFQSVKIYGWTDSTIVLAWLRSPPNRWKTFVANRVSQIQRLSVETSWRHVPTQDNPADVASRGIKPENLKSHPLWWSGPHWLLQNEYKWPKSNLLFETQDEQNQVKSFATSINQTEMYPNFEKYSSYLRLIRCWAYVFRFIHKSRKTTHESRYITVPELNFALNFCIKQVQQQSFSEQINKLSSNERLNSHDKLLSLNPFIDGEGFLRVGGRLENSHLDYDAKHPRILPSNHHFVKLIINYYHRLTLHAGSQVVSSIIRQKYWLINARSTVRNVISKCVICRRHQAKVQSQLMGQLPSIRTDLSRPFQHVGVDYAGPFEVKLHNARGARFFKSYICLFVCMAVKAVHLELVSDLSTAGFLGAFKRFSARRGLCSTITSDNGTNFVGAARIMKEDFDRSTMESEIAKLLCNDGTTWNFIPPAAPNFGGLWEAGIKSTKYHLKRVLGNSNLSFEEFTTVLAQIESVLNSRPLCPLTADPNDLNALTPGHFLIGDTIITSPQPSLLDIKMHRLDRWKRTQQIFQSFWKRYSLEYVSRQQQRPKWLQKQTNLSINDMVLIKDERLPPLKWLLGRVIDTHSGPDGLVRVVTVRTKNGETLKSVSKLCLLPQQDAEVHP